MYIICIHLCIISVIAVHTMYITHTYCKDIYIHIFTHIVLFIQYTYTIYRSYGRLNESIDRTRDDSLIFCSESVEKSNIFTYRLDILLILRALGILEPGV